MVIAQIFGGLGNQMFQYAAGKALAVHHNVPFKLDVLRTKGYKREEFTYRDFLLKKFFIKTELATPREISEFKNETASFEMINSIKRRIKKIQAYKYSYYQEPFTHFEVNFFKAKKCVYLEGYWQSEKYFAGIKDIIRKEFQLKKPATGKNAKLAREIKKVPSVSIHIRRGDYITDSAVTKKLGICALSYYEKSIFLIKERVRDPHFFVFSDDIEWAKKKLKVNKKVVFVDYNNSESAFEDFRLMSQCKHNIIANSSFSWWSAWLNPSLDKIIVAPEPWFGILGKSHDIIPENWIRIPKA